MKINPIQNPDDATVEYDEIRASFSGGLIVGADKKSTQYNFRFNIIPVRINPDTLGYEDSPSELHHRISVDAASKSGKTGIKKMQQAFDKIISDYLKDIGWA